MEKPYAGQVAHRTLYGIALCEIPRRRGQLAYEVRDGEMGRVERQNVEQDRVLIVSVLDDG